MSVITRKIELRFDTEDKDHIKQIWNQWYEYSKYVFKAANLISTHCFVQQNIKDFFYFAEDFKIRLDNIEKGEGGVMNTSKRNSTYQMASRKFLEHLPSSVLSSLNSIVYATYTQEYKEMMTGKKSLRSYRYGMPIPFQMKNMKNIHVCDSYGNYGFLLFKTPFKTFFGKDKSGNRNIFERALDVNDEAVKLCDSSIQSKDKKMFLLAVFDIKKEKIPLDPEKVCEVEFDIKEPVQCRVQGKKKWYYIGDNEVILEQRKRIRLGLHRQKKAAKYSVSGKGRKRKVLDSIKKFHKAEHNYVRTKVHQFTYKIVEFAINNNCGVIHVNYVDIKEDDPERQKFLLSLSCASMIKECLHYKTKSVGIELVYEKEPNG